MWEDLEAWKFDEEEIYINLSCKYVILLLIHFNKDTS